MANYTSGLTNGVSWGYKHTVTATDQTDGFIRIDFQSDNNVKTALAYQVMVLAETTGAWAVLTGALITEPAVGQIRIANGGSLSLTAGQVIHIIAQTDSSVYTY